MASIRELILRNVETVLKTIDGTGSFNHNLDNRVYRTSLPGGKIVDTPTVLIPEPTQTSKRIAKGSQDRLDVELTISIIGFLQEAVVDTANTTNLSEGLDELMSDIQRAIMADITRGGNAWITELGAIHTEFTESGLAKGTVIVPIIIRFRQRADDPNLT